MRRILLLLVLLPVLATAQSASNSPIAFFKRAELGLPQTIGRQSFTWDKTIECSGSLRVVADSKFSNFTYTGEGPAFRFVELKDASLAGIHVTCTNPKATAFEFASTSSSSRNTLLDCWAKGAQYGFRWTDGGSNADLSNFLVMNSHAERCTYGFAIEGGNALAPWLFQVCTASYCGAGFDFTKGGSGVSVAQCGGSYTDTLFRTAGGFGFNATGIVAEECGTVWKTGEADGYGQPTPQSMQVVEARGTKNAIAVVDKAGKVTLDLQTVFGPCKVTGENRSSAPLDLLCPNVVPAVAVKGAVRVNGQVAQID